MTGDTATRERALLAMRDPAFYGLPSTVEVEMRETHASLVFLAGERAYKVKKPVRLPFLDYGTLARRHGLCLDEVRLNRTFAPGTYFGVRAIVGDGGGFRLGDADDGSAVEYAVEMRRLDERRTLERLVRTGAADERLLERVARRIAELHAAAPPVGGGGPDDALARAEENVEALRPHAGPTLDPALLEAVRRHAEAFAGANRDLMAGRAASGRVRDCHGDLRAEHVVVENGIVIFDRIEFDERLRHIDVACDVAFTVMDLERLEAGALGHAFVRAYVDASGDAGLRALVPFYASYRAAVRAKVACIRLEQAGAEAERGRLAEQARSLLELALRFVWRSRFPLALVFSGVAGSGKSTLAVEAARRSGLRRISSDTVRKELAGVPPGERAGAGAYASEETARTYRELARRSVAELRREGGVIVDATYRDRARRRTLAAALRGAGARVLFVECRAPADVLRRRGGERERLPQLGSDATWDVIASQLGSFEPLDEVPAPDRLAIATDRPVPESLAELEALVSEAVDRVPVDPH